MQNATRRCHIFVVALLSMLVSACAARQPVLSPTAMPTVVPATLGAATPTAERAVLTASATPSLTPTPAPAAFFDDMRLTYEPNFYVPQLQAWLDTQPGTLKGMNTVVGGRRHSFAETLIGQTSYYSANPKVILALLEVQSGLVSSPEPTADQLAYAIGFQEKDGWRRGIQAQVRWAVRQMVYARRDFPQRVSFSFADKSTAPPPDGITLGEYVIANVLAPTTTPDQLRARLDRFLETYSQLFGDPRQRLEMPPPAAPFLSWPLERAAPVTSFFDHGGPFLTRVKDAPVTTYWGRDETDAAFAYDGHDGWDYAAAPPQLALAAADGDVVFAGNADDNCSTRAVVLDHGNGYRTFYWHLARVDAEIGQHVMRGDGLGVIGESGCATGPHLHFGVQYLGRNTDPYGWCGAGPDPWATHPAGTENRWLWADRISPCAPAPPDITVVDNTSPGFRTTGEGWETVIPGYAGDALAIASFERPPAPTPTPDPNVTPEPEPTPRKPVTAEPTAQPTTPTPPPVPATARWTARVPKDGMYRVLAYIPYALSGLNDAREVRYRVRSVEGEDEVTVSQSVAANEWAYLGTYSFRAGQDAVVTLENFAELGGSSVWADAIIWQPVVETTPAP